MSTAKTKQAIPYDEKRDFHWLLRKKTYTATDFHTTSLKRSLGVWDLTALGVAAILGAGVFSTIGNAASSGGPAVVFLFIFTAICCTFSALCYAQFASSIPGAGSAYSYAYASFGEIVAWIIGWDLLMEYAIGNIAVAISWSGYFTSMLQSYGIILPKYITLDYLSAQRAFTEASTQNLQALSPAMANAYEAWITAPTFLGIHLICDVPAFLITALITTVVYLGIEESKRLANSMVILKVAVVLLVIGVGAAYVNPSNWQPFNPEGLGGVVKGVSAVFFAYIGFDAISTAAEECKNPQRDLPRGMIYSLIICTVLYIGVSLVLTGIVPYTRLGVEDPLAYVFGTQGVNIPWINWVVTIGALIALSTVLLVFQLGQPRIWMAMSRDGLLPPIFSSIHPKYKTPWFSTLVTGFAVAFPALFMNLTEVTDLTSIGTLFAFALVSAGAIAFQGTELQRSARFKVPYINAKYIFPAILVTISLLTWAFYSTEIKQAMAAGLDFKDWILRISYMLLMVGLAVLCYTRNLSLIPVLGLATSTYLMCELGILNWLRFGLWLVIGLVLYFLYGAKHSALRTK